MPVNIIFSSVFSASSNLGFAIERDHIFPGSGRSGVYDVYAANSTNSIRQLLCSSPVCLSSMTETGCALCDSGSSEGSSEGLF